MDIAPSGSRLRAAFEGRDAATGVRTRLSWRGELVTTLLGTWLMIGLFLDGWAHANLNELETFFTPWHGVFYSGFVATAAWVIWQVDRRSRSGARGLDAVPAGYGLALVGIGVFAAGAIGDMLWHLGFGIEISLDALFSPTHILLAVGIMLIMSAPLRAAWGDPAEDNAPRFGAFLPVLLSATLTTTLIAFMFMFLGVYRFSAAGLSIFGPMTHPDEAVQGVSGVLATNLMVTAPLLLLARRWRLPFGTATFLIGIVGILTNAIGAFETWWLMVAAVAGGLATDVMLARVRPADGDRRRFWLAGALIPVAVWTVYFLVVQLFEGVSWVVELWTGSIVWSAILGAILAVLMRPPAVPAPAGVPGGRDGAAP